MNPVSIIYSIAAVIGILYTDILWSADEVPDGISMAFIL